MLGRKESFVFVNYNKVPNKKKESLNIFSLFMCIAHTPLLFANTTKIQKWFVIW
jgi:hypothetical protein